MAPVLEQLWSQGVTADFVHMDLGSLDSVRRAAGDVASFGPLDLIIADAGIAGRRGSTDDGFELAFGVNHLGHFLLLRLLISQLPAASGARVVVVSSEAHRGADGIDWGALRRPTRSLTGYPEYEVSKLCNILHVRELARREPSLEVLAVHPGMVATGMWDRVPQPVRWFMKRRMIEPAEGAEAVIHCAVEVEDQSGTYWAGTRRRSPSEHAQDGELAAELWERSMEWTS